MRTRAQRNNNPINIEFAHQPDSCLEEGDHARFACFSSPEAGWRAAHAQIKKDAGRGLTLKQFILKFAPPIENDTTDYLEFVKKELGQGSDVLLSHISKYALAGVMACWEGYYNNSII